MKKRKKIESRFPTSLALKAEMYSRLEKLRNIGWRVSEIFILGIENAERKDAPIRR